MFETTLANGIQVLSEHIPGVRSAAVGVWVRRGSAHELPDGRYGRSAFRRGEDPLEPAEPALGVGHRLIGYAQCDPV